MRRECGKKLISLLIVSAFVLSLFACSGAPSQTPNVTDIPETEEIGASTGDVWGNEYDNEHPGETFVTEYVPETEESTKDGVAQPPIPDETTGPLPETTHPEETTGEPNGETDLPYEETTNNDETTDAPSEESTNDAGNIEEPPANNDNKGFVTPSRDATTIILDESVDVSFPMLCDYMANYRKLEYLEASDEVLTASEYTLLCSLNPDVKFATRVEFEGNVYNFMNDVLNMSDIEVENKKAFEKLISYAPEGIKFVMCDCGYSNEEMAALREKFPNHEFAWRIYMGKWSLRTDDEAFSVMVYHYNYKRMTSKDIEVLKYCTNMYALDLGHQAITDLTTIGNMTDLKVLILADNLITDVTPLANLKDLEYLELFVNNIKDVSPIASCTKLVDLNLGWNYRINDISSIYSLERIERLWLPTTSISWTNYAEINSNFPRAKIVYSDEDSISSGWRTHYRYYSMRNMFLNNRYDPYFIFD